MVLYTKTTFHQRKIQHLKTLGLLLHYLPNCDTSEQRDSIMQEVRRLRKEIVFVEEMTRSEKLEYVKWKIMTIESDLNNN